MLYTLGRFWIENLRIDEVQLLDVGGLRFNVWTSIVLFVLAAAYFAWAGGKRPGREEQVYTQERLDDDQPTRSRPPVGRPGRLRAEIAVSPRGVRR